MKLLQLRICSMQNGVNLHLVLKAFKLLGAWAICFSARHSERPSLFFSLAGGVRLLRGCSLALLGRPKAHSHLSRSFCSVPLASISIFMLITFGLAQALHRGGIYGSRSSRNAEKKMEATKDVGEARRREIHPRRCAYKKQPACVYVLRESSPFIRSPRVISWKRKGLYPDATFMTLQHQVLIFPDGN